MEEKDLPTIKNITISGRIGSGATTLAKGIAEILGWEMLDGGKILRKVQEEIGANVYETSKRPDRFDLDYEAKIKNILTHEAHNVIQSHLAGFDAQGIEGVFKILVVCEDDDGNDKQEIRIDRLVNRDQVSIEDAKHEIGERDRQNLEKWRRLYANSDESWVYWDRKYYDLIINTYKYNKEEALQKVIDALGITT